MSDWNRLALVAAPAGDVLSLDAAKAHLNYQAGDRDDDIRACVSDAVAQVDGPDGVGLCLLTQTWRLSLDCWPRRGGIVIPLRPVQSIEAITYVDPDDVQQTLAPDQYACDLDHAPATIVPAWNVHYWPSLKRAPGVVKVEFKAGFGDLATAIPGDIVGAVKLIAGHRFYNRVDGPDLAEIARAALARRIRPVA